MSERLEWPVGFERTPANDRDSKQQLRRLAVEGVRRSRGRAVAARGREFRYSFDAQQRQRDQRPYARAIPDDPGFVLRGSYRVDSALAIKDGEYTQPEISVADRAGDLSIAAEGQDATVPIVAERVLTLPDRAVTVEVFEYADEKPQNETTTDPPHRSETTGTCR